MIATMHTSDGLQTAGNAAEQGGAVIGQLHRVIHDIEHEWANKRLLVVGDVMLDKYVWGEVGRISPEAPVPVVRGMHQDEKPGGAANVAMNLARLGAQTVVVGITGGDENEKLLAASLRSNGDHAAFHRLRGIPDHHQNAHSGRASANAAPRL